MRNLKEEIEGQLERLQRVKSEVLEDVGVDYFEQIPVECIQEIANYEMACADIVRFNAMMNRLLSLENDFAKMVTLAEV